MDRKFAFKIVRPPNNRADKDQLSDLLVQVRRMYIAVLNIYFSNIDPAHMFSALLVGAVICLAGSRATRLRIVTSQGSKSALTTTESSAKNRTAWQE